MDKLKAYIENINFDCRRNRYDAAQVDEFIANVQSQLSDIEEYIRALKEKNAAFESQSASMAAAMITAEKNSAEIVAKAEAQAQEIVAAAQREGEDFVNSMQERQAAMENAYAEEEKQLIKQIQSLKSFKERYHHAIERDVVDVLSRISSLESNKVWNDWSEEMRREYGLDEAYAGIDLNEIIKDLPETDSELKQMIEGLL